jgi:hypothetical protein
LYRPSQQLPLSGKLRLYRDKFPSIGQASPCPGKLSPYWASFALYRDNVPASGQAFPRTGITFPSSGPALPRTGIAFPSSGRALPRTGIAFSSRGRALPRKGIAFPSGRQGFPFSGGERLAIWGCRSGTRRWLRNSMSLPPACRCGFAPAPQTLRNRVRPSGHWILGGCWCITRRFLGEGRAARGRGAPRRERGDQRLSNSPNSAGDLGLESGRRVPSEE